jgi:hypothetical protein
MRALASGMTGGHSRKESQMRRLTLFTAMLAFSAVAANAQPAMDTGPNSAFHACMKRQIAPMKEAAEREGMATAAPGQSEEAARRQAWMRFRQSHMGQIEAAKAACGHP